ncbi:MAG: T9SS type A sorting domain-containing protein [bacterium]
MRLIGLSAVFAAVVLLCLAPAAFPGWHCGDIDIGAGPVDLVIDPITGDMFVATTGSHVARINEETYEVSSFYLPEPASALALDPARRLLYAALPASSLLTALNIDTSDTSLVRVGAGASAIAVDAVRGRVFVLNPGDSTISVIEGGIASDTLRCAGSPFALAVDPATGAGFATIPDNDLLMSFDVSAGDTAYFTTGSEPAAVEIDAEKGEIYIATEGTSAVSVFGIETDSLFNIAIGGTPADLCVNPETNKLYVGTSSGVTIVGTETHTTENIALAEPPHSVAVDPLSDRAIASLPGLGRIVEIGPAADTLLVDVPGTPGMLLVNPVTNRYYACNSAASGISVVDGANYSGFMVAAGGGPGLIRINYETHEVYCPNWFSADVTVIDGLTNAVSSFDVADGPNTVRINPITDDVYIVCAWANLLVVKRAGQPDTLNAHLGGYSRGIAFNQNTGKLYVSNRFTDNVSVVDMQTLDTTLVRAGGYPCNVVTSMEHNRVYVTNRTSWTLSVIEGATLSNTYTRIGHKPTGLTLNPVTNTIYTVEPDSRSISAVDCETLERTKIPVGLQPSALSLNANTNKVFVSSRQDRELTVVDGATLSRTPVRCGFGLAQPYPEVWTNKIFAVSWDEDNVTLIDGNFLSSTTIPVGHEPHHVDYDPVLEKLYVGNHAGNSIEIMQLREKISPRLAVSVDTLSHDVAYTPTPTITGSASSTRIPNNFGVMKVLWKVDNLRGAWNEATLTGSGPHVDWSLTTMPLALGSHLLFVTALDSTACTLSSSSSSSLQRLSDISAYEFTCLSPPPAPPLAIDPEVSDVSVDLAWTPTSGERGWYDLELATDPAFTENVVRVERLDEPEYSFDPDLLAGQSCYWRVAAIDYPHGKRSPFSDTFSIDLVGNGPSGRGPVSAMLDAYPNPAQGDVVLRFSTPDERAVECLIYDVEGRLVATLPMYAFEEGMSTTWNTIGSTGVPVPPGVYFARIKAPEMDLQRKIVLIH